jgi:hypothetical protein
MDQTYDVVYWFHPNGKYRIVMDQNFKDRFNISSIYQQPYFDEFKNYIDYKVLPSRDEIWKEYDIIVEEEE